jgi:Zn ribbon nucleic-acid-binding protein
VFCKIEYDDKNSLSISGVIGPTRGGNARGGCGQIDMEFYHFDKSENDSRYDEQYLIKAGDFNFADGWSAGNWYQFLHVWKRWHLNDMCSECEHQEELGWTWKTHPSAECPTCGYKLGHAWKRREVPRDVIDFLMGLPDTDRQPAWV